MTPDSGARDKHFLRRALVLARRGGKTHPNPQVGAVLVRDGRIVGEGFHRGIGTPHAETAAFAAAGEQARGATIYVTLEPCAHTTAADGSLRTPCALRCIQAGVVRVVCALTDPDSRVAGRGFERLHEAGIAVTVGVCDDAARQLLRAYVKHRTTGLPYVTHKAALTLDGKIAAPSGDSKWVTSAPARRYAHRALRARSDALVVGVGTVLADDPKLTTRLPSGNGPDPVRVLIDSRLRTPPTAKAVRAARSSPVGTLVLAVAGLADAGRRAALEAAGAQVVLVSADPESGRVDVREAARLLAGRGLLAVLLESGGELAASWWQAGLVDEVSFFVAPKIIGGRGSATPVGGDGLGAAMANAVTLDRLTIRRFGPDIALEGKVDARYVYRNH